MSYIELYGDHGRAENLNGEDMTDSRPEITAKASLDGNFVVLTLGKQWPGYPPVSMDFPLSYPEVLALAWDLQAAAQDLLHNATDSSREPMMDAVKPKPETWRDRESML